MSTFGKILAVINVLFAIIFLVFAGKDYGKQYSWSHAELRYRLAIIGLPVDNTDIDDRNPENPEDHAFVEKLTPGVVKDVFQGVEAKDDPNGLGGEPVRTLFEEVDRVAKKVRANVEGEAEPKQKGLLRVYLLGLAKTSGERDEYQKILDAPEWKEKGLAKIDELFSNAKKNSEMGTANKKEQRAKIAHVLVNVNPTEQWRKRVMTVVGMEAYIDALNRQADSYMAMVSNLQQAMATDQTTFERQHADLVRAILDEADELYRANAFLAELTKSAAERTTQANLRDAEKMKYEARLVQARAETTDDFKNVFAIQKDLFGLQQKLGQAMRRNQELEGELRKLEQNDKR
jgi:hypothetical protein